MKRVVSFLLVLACLLSLCVVSHAAEPQGNEEKMRDGLLRAMELFSDDAFMDHVIIDLNLTDTWEEEKFVKEYIEDDCEQYSLISIINTVFASIKKEKVYELSLLDSVRELSYEYNAYMFSNDPLNVLRPEISKYGPKIENQLADYMDRKEEDEAFVVSVQLANVPSAAQMEAWIAQELAAGDYSRYKAEDAALIARRAVRTRVYLPMERAFVDRCFPEGGMWYRCSDITPFVLIKLTKAQVLALAQDAQVESLLYCPLRPEDFTSAPKPEVSPECERLEAALAEAMAPAAAEEAFTVRLDLNTWSWGEMLKLRDEMEKMYRLSGDLLDRCGSDYRAKRQVYLAAEEAFAREHLQNVRYQLIPLRPTIYVTATKAQIMEWAELEEVELIRGAADYFADLPNFADVAQSDYFARAVDWAVMHSPAVTTGTDAAHFSPARACTRAEAVTFLWRANGCPAAQGAAFDDVPADAYYAEAVAWAREQGITTGTSAAAFSPERICTRAEIITMLWRSLGEPEGLPGIPFDDVSPEEYYLVPVAWAYHHNVSNGTSQLAFSPDKPCTRAEIITFLYRAQEN